VKKLSILLWTLFATAASTLAQVTDASACDVLASPQAFDGKLVRIKGTVAAGFDEFVIKDPACKQSINGIWVAYPEGTRGKAGPAAVLQLQLARNNPVSVSAPTRSPVKLDKNKDFKQFDSLLSTPYKSRGMCLGCVRYAVSATLVGRLDGVKDVGIARDKDGKFISVSGFGNLNLYHARLVLQVVSDVSPHEIDYSKAISAPGEDSSSESGGDPVAAEHAAARAFGQDSELGRQVERAAAAFGKQGEDNGVGIGFAASNEVSKTDGSKGENDSPDGLLFNCTFDMDKLKGDALERAIAHVGTHIADLRDQQTAAANATAYALEYRAWQTAVLNAIAFKQKTLTAPGGYLLWNAAWTDSGRSKMVDDAISGFLTNWAALKQ